MALESLVAALEQSRSSIDRLAPDPTGKHDKAAVAGVIRDVKHKLIEALPLALEGAAEDDRPKVRDAVLSTALDAAGLALAAGDDDAGRRLLRDVRGLATGSALDVEATAASDAPLAFAWLNYGRWLHNKKKYGKAESALAKAAKLTVPLSAAASSSTPNPSGSSATVRPASTTTLRDLIAQALEAPRPIDKVPGLSTVNGIGQMLYGKRDVWSDGSYVTTLFFTFLFCPVIPLSSWRVQDAGSGSYRFYFGTRLSTLARWWRKGIAAFAAATAVVVIGTTWWNAPDRRLAAAVDDAAAVAKTDVDAAVRAVGAALMTFPNAGNDARNAAASTIFVWRSQTLPQPLTRDGLVRLVRDASMLPKDTKEGMAPLRDAVLAWLQENPAAKVDDRLDLVTRAMAAIPNSPALARQKAALEIESITATSTVWPATAATRLARLDGPTASAALGDILATAPSTGALEAVAGPARRFVATSPDAAAAAAVAARLATVDARVAARAPLLQETATLAAQKTWLQKNPDDQVVAAAVIVAAFDKEDLATAQKTLGAAGPSAWWSPDLLDLGSSLAQAQGNLREADVLLDQALSPRIGEFAAAGEKLNAAYKGIEEGLYQSANAGTLPAATMERLRNADEATQGQIFGELMTEKVAKSAAITTARAELDALGPVVAQSLRSGSLKLRLAAEAPPAQQPALLKAAEDAFLAVAAFAGNDVRFQLGLGEVKYRTQQADEGKKLLDAVVAQGDPRLSLSVAQVFRNVGALEPARETAQKVLDTSSGVDSAHDAAAHLLSIMATTFADRERFVGLIESKNDDFEALRASIRAEHFELEGKVAEADRELAKEAAIYEKDAGRDVAAANNASLAWSRRFSLTGDPKAMQKATSLMLAARKLAPTSAIVAANLLNLEAQTVVVDLLAPHVDLQALHASVAGVAAAARRPLPGAAAGTAIADLVKQRTSANPRFRSLAEEVRTLAPSSADAWLRLTGIYGHVEDEAALTQLGQQLEKNVVDVTQRQVDWNNRADPARIDLSRTALTVELARLQKLQPKDTKTQAAVAVLIAGNQDGLGRLDHDEARLQQAVDSLALAESLWPALDTRPERASTLTALALLRAAKTSPVLAGLIKADPWFDDGLLALVLQDENKEARVALAAEPATRAALDLRVARGEPSSRAFALARVLGDVEAEKAHASALKSPANRVFWALTAKLASFHPESVAWAALAAQP